PGSERVTAARPSFWSENAYHLSQMAAVRWLSLRTWHELGGMQRDGAVYELALPYVRPAVLLWLATLGPDEWVTLDGLAAFLRARAPLWDRATFSTAPPLEPQPTTPARARPLKSRARDDEPASPPTTGTLDALLLGAAYQIGLIRSADEVGSGLRAVQLTPLGRYLLAMGPPPAPRPAYEHFLFVQPNFEVIAYRQGLTPSLIGQFSRFALWSQVGAATALRLTPESVYRGLEGDQTAEQMLDLLARHSQRPLPAGISEAVRTWAGRRERVTYHASATLVEFATPGDLEQALAHWPAGPGPAPVRVSDRLVLVEDESAIPFSRFRMTGSRDYRRPPDVCVEVEADGVS
ncbi:MAG: helicase-associated domain-containing protein, partial [Planctomycetia bacterium]|nr:helicase-associated domain-containing protein [Planctomycetia bacterium]